MTDWMALYKDIGARIRIARMLYGMTQAELGEIVGYSHASIGNIEAGRQAIPLHRLYDMAEVLGVDIDALLPSNTRTAVITTSSTSAALWAEVQERTR